MKKMISVLLAAAMTVSALSVTAFAEEEYDVLAPQEVRDWLNVLPVYANGEDVSAYELGDVNMDGTVDTKDATLICHEFNLYVLLEYGHALDNDQLSLANVNGDQRVDTRDAIDVLNYFCKTIIEAD